MDKFTKARQTIQLTLWALIHVPEIILRLFSSSSLLIVYSSKECACEMERFSLSQNVTRNWGDGFLRATVSFFLTVLSKYYRSMRIGNESDRRVRNEMNT